MGEQARHPGQDDDDDDDESSMQNGDEEDGSESGSAGKIGGGAGELQYAGGKILCLLGNPPLETAPPSVESLSYENQPNFYDGGIAGCCFDQVQFQFDQKNKLKEQSKSEEEEDNESTVVVEKKKKKKKKNSSALTPLF